MISDPPSAFVAEWLPKARALLPASARALDLAMGRGRHALLLARSGFHTFGVDLKHEAVVDAVGRAAASGLTIRAWCADLEMYPLPRRAFDLVIVTRYLQRNLMASLCESLRSGGVILYETFTVDQLAHGKGPRSPDHLLRKGELAASFPGFEILFEEEVFEPEAVARVVALRP